MRYKFISLYKLIGVNRPKDTEPQIINESKSLKIKSSLVYEIDTYLEEIDRSSKVSHLILTSVFGPAREGTFEEVLKSELKLMKENRAKENGLGAFVLFEAEGDVDDFRGDDDKDLDEFVVSFSGPSKREIKRKYQKYIGGVIAGCSLSYDQICGIKKITDGIVFFREDGIPVYSFRFVSSGSGILSIGLDPSLICFAQKYSKSLFTNQLYIESSRLLTRSLDDSNDELQSFLSAWAGLEIFVNKTFKHYEEIIYRKFHEAGGNGSEAVLSIFLDRTKRVMRDKYRLTDKFSLICHELDPKGAEQDMSSFDRMKGIRDKLMHGNDIDLSTLPVIGARQLLAKYMKLSLEKKLA